MRTLALKVPAPLSGGGSSSTSAGVIVSVTPRSAVRADLGRVDEAQIARGGVDHEPVEDVLAVVVDHLVDGPDLGLVGCEHGRPRGHRRVVDRWAVVDHRHSIG